MLMSCDEQRIGKDDVEETGEGNVLEEKDTVLDDMVSVNI